MTPTHFHSWIATSFYVANGDFDLASMRILTAKSHALCDDEESYQNIQLTKVKCDIPLYVEHMLTAYRHSDSTDFDKFARSTPKVSYPLY